MKEYLRFENLCISINDRILYDNLNLTINQGDRFMLMGPNGAGKSLLMNLLIYGYSKVMIDDYEGLKISGKILDKNGNDLLDPSTKRKIAYAAQNEDPYNNTTILTEAETACHGVDIDLDEDMLDELLAFFGISHLKTKKIKNRVSGGESKLISLITRILQLPAADILLLDEPINHLSFENSKKFNDLLSEEIKKNPNITIIMVSHCRAMNFTDKALQYNVDHKVLDIKEYKSYDCFTIQ